MSTAFSVFVVYRFLCYYINLGVPSSSAGPAVVFLILPGMLDSSDLFPFFIVVAVLFWGFQAFLNSGGSPTSGP